MTSPLEAGVGESLGSLQDRLTSDSLKDQLQVIQEIAALGDVGLDVLMNFLKDHQLAEANPVNGRIVQVLIQADTPTTREFLSAHLPNGLIPMPSERAVDYTPLQMLLAQQDYQEADRVTLQKMCELAGSAAVQRKWLYFSEVDGFPITDMHTIDTLWRVYSEGKFGFSVQREIWLGLGKDWDRLWPRIGWRRDNTWTRYPTQFVWDLSAPRGHLPLSNQLRGVRVMASLMNHPAWSEGDRPSV